MGNGSSFEGILQDLEQIVRQLERGDVPLEESLTLFAQGVALCQKGQGQLTQAEQTIQQLIRDESGQWVTQEWDPSTPTEGEER